VQWRGRGWKGGRGERRRFGQVRGSFVKAYALIRYVGLSLAASVISGASRLTGWIGQVGWGAATDHRGRKFSLYILAIGGAITLLAMIFIQNVALAWIILIRWGLVRDSPYPVLYAAVMHRPRLRLLGARADDRPRFGGLGIFSPAAQGYLVDNFGFTVHYVVLAGICLLTLVPIAVLRQSSEAGGGTREAQTEG
jgi:MFS family permease